MRPLSNIAQLGGVYLQAFTVGDFLVASRIGGLQLFSINAGALIPKSTLPLAAVPYLEKESGGLVAVFKESAYRVQITSDEQILLHATSLDMQYLRPLETNQSVTTDQGVFLLDRKNGILLDTAQEKEFKLPGYSRPSTILVSDDRQTLYIADVGRIHCFSISQKVFGQGYSSPGWPKDVCVLNDDVFVANVYGITWYKELKDYPYLALQAKVNFPHFRIAKVIIRGKYVYACDEARGVHVFLADKGSLLPKGGIMCDGGGWDCNFIDDDLYIANGGKGWCRLKKYTPEKTFSHPDLKITYDDERVQAISDWPEINAIVILSNGYARVLRKNDYSLLFSFQANAWAGCAAGNLFFVATADGIIVLKKNRDGEVITFERIATTEARDIFYDESHIWIADGKGGIKCFLITQNTIKYVGTFPVCGFSRGLFVTSGRLYVGAGDGGLVVIEKR